MRNAYKPHLYSIQYSDSNLNIFWNITISKSALFDPNFFFGSVLIYLCFFFQGYTPLHIAMQFRHENVYKLLVEVYGKLYQWKIIIMNETNFSQHKPSLYLLNRS